MPVLRSREFAPKSLPSPSPPPALAKSSSLEPASPAMRHVPPSPSASSTTPLSGPGFDSSRSVPLPARRRSLRLAASRSVSFPPPSAVAINEGSVGGRKRKARVCESPGGTKCEVEIRGDVVEEGGKARVLEVEKGCDSFEDGEKEDFGDAFDALPEPMSQDADSVDGRYMNLRSGMKIARRLVEEQGLASNQVLNGAKKWTRSGDQDFNVCSVAKAAEVIAVEMVVEDSEMSAEEELFDAQEEAESKLGFGVNDAGLQESSDNAEKSVKQTYKRRPKGTDVCKGKYLASEVTFLNHDEDDDQAEVLDEFVGDGIDNAKNQHALLSIKRKIIRKREREAEAEGKHSNLRSSSRISRRGIKINTIDSKLVEKDVAMARNVVRDRQENKGKSVRYSFHVEKGIDTISKVRIEGLDVGQAKAKMDDKSVVSKISAEAKGKRVLVVEEDSSAFKTEINKNLDSAVVKEVVEHSGNNDLSESNGRPSMTRTRRETERAKAMELAPKFAFFKDDSDKEGCKEPQEDSDQEAEDMLLNDEHEDWPGPFSTALKIIEKRYERLRVRESNSSSKQNVPTKVKIPWTPSKDKNCKNFGCPPPALKDLCLNVLLDNAEEIESLDGIPDVLKHRFMLMLCHSRKMTSHLLGLLVCSIPTEIHLSDCSWATEGQFEEIFSNCNTNNLKTVQLDLCGRCMSDYVLRTILAKFPNCLPLLTSLSLKGAYRLSNDGLHAIVSAAPSLSSINLSQCSLLTSLGIRNLAEKLDHVLREIYIDDCHNVDAMVILPALMKLKHLEVLSVAGIQSVCNKFVRQLIPACGSNIKELVFAGCGKLTDASLKVIGENCSMLCAIDLRNLNRLTDSGIRHLANGCRSLQKLKLRRNAFSDGAVAAFLEASGGSLTELSLNNVGKVAQHTAIAISQRCFSTLQILDLSFCRELTDEALGLIVDNCSHLRILKLFGCSQVTDVFLDGHLNPQVKIIGLKGEALSQIEIPDFF